MVYLDNDRFSGSSGALIFLICSCVLFLGSIAVFIWLLVDSAEGHLLKNVLYGSAFLIISLGVLLYTLFVSRGSRVWTAVLWVSMLVGISAFIAGLCLKSPAPRPVVFDDGTPVGEVVYEDLF